MAYTFKEKGHAHLWNGKKMTGVTTILGVIAKPALIGWSANMAVDYVKENSKAIVRTEINKDTGEPEDILECYEVHPDTLEEARKAHTKKKEAAGDIGKSVHGAIEEFIKNGTEPQLDEQGMRMFENFRKWMIDNKVKFIENEKHLYSERLFLAGICDAIVEINGEKWIFDWKTGGNRVYPEAFFQMGGYEILLKEMNEHQDIVGYGVLGIFKDGTMQEERSKSNEDNKQAFQSAYTLYRITNKIKSEIN